MSAKAISKKVGTRSWRSWAGRSGTDGDGQSSAVADAFVGVYRAMKWRMPFAPPPDKTCPICFDDDVGNASQWLRLWCGCSVCNTCAGTWAKAALDGAAGAAIIEGAEDESPVVALSCPACSAPLRPCDARKLLERDQALLTEFDIGLRDACLRGSADYRPCPHCKAGGFVTWRCVAMARAGPRAAARIIGGFVTFGCIRVAAGGRLAKLAALPPDESEDATLIFIAIVCLATSHGVLKVARWAAAEAPMDVSCPECDARFPLASNDAAADSASATAVGPSSHVKGHDAADAAWVREHTRPCPRCRAPILKNGGCNAMKCGRCGLHFCWACMRSSSACTHFKCANNAPYGNASMWDQQDAVNGDALANASEQAARFARSSAGVATALALAAIAVWLLRQVDGGFSHAGHVAASAEWLLGMPMRSPKFWTLLSMPWFYDLRRDLVVAGFA